jgi:DNA polymerase III gamma/tau subunit
MSLELYRKYRPKCLDEVLGQPEAVKQLADWLENGRMPHTTLFSGSSGCGKTTLARIAARWLLDSPLKRNPDFESVNAAEARGIDKIREVQDRMGMSPLGGKCRVWIFDECHRLTGDSQSALLETLEDTPDNVYFMLCTTDPNKLLLAIRTRCSHLTVATLSSKTMKQLVQSVTEKENIEIELDTLDALIECAEGSARKALVILNQIRGLPPKEHLAAVQKADTKKKAFDIASALIWKKKKWPEIAAMIDALEDDNWEGIRHLILTCAGNELLKEKDPSGSKAFAILEIFRSHWYDSKRAGLIHACADVFQQGQK